MAYQEDIEVLQDFNEERDLYDRPEEPNKSKTDLKKKLKSKPVKKWTNEEIKILLRNL